MIDGLNYFRVVNLSHLSHAGGEIIRTKLDRIDPFHLNNLLYVIDSIDMFRLHDHGYCIVGRLDVFAE